VTRHAITWNELSAIEPTIDEVHTHAASLARAYNDPRNAPLLGHTAVISQAEVVEIYETMVAGGGRPFLLFRHGAFAGDGDLRGITDGRAEFAFLVASPDAQGQGLGTRFATMIHAFAFDTLGLSGVYASVIPANVASRRVFEKLGYTEVTGKAAHDYGDEGDVVLALERTRFAAVNGAALAEIRIAPR
jgi:RimJ/RimL family protein N-acetyltransferase